MTGPLPPRAREALLSRPAPSLRSGLRTGLIQHRPIRSHALREHGLVIDRWAQRDDQGKVVGEHADECCYLTRYLSETTDVVPRALPIARCQPRPRCRAGLGG